MTGTTHDRGAARRTGRLFLSLLAFSLGIGLGGGRVAAAAPVTDDQKQLYIDEQLRFADGLMDRGHYALAIDEYQRLIRQFPDDPLVADAWMQLAEAHVAQGRDDFARRLYEEFLRKFTGVPTYAAAEVNYARLLLRSEQAAEQVRGQNLLAEVRNRAGAPEVVREGAEYYWARHLAAAKDGQDAAAEVLARLAMLPVDDVERHRFRALAATELADLRLRQERPDEALRLLTPLAAAAATPPEIQSVVWQMIAAIHWNGERFTEAAEAYGRLAVLFPESEAGREAPVRRIEALYRAGSGRELLREADIWLARGGETPYRDRVLFLKAATLQDEGFFATAAGIYAELVVTAADRAIRQRAAFQHLVCLRQDGKAEVALAAVRGWLNHPELAPETRADLVELAVAPPTSDETGLALLREGVAAIGEVRARSRLQLRLAGGLLATGKPAEALPLYREIAGAVGNQAETNVAARFGEAACLEALGRNDEAIAAYRAMPSTDVAVELKTDAALRLALLLLRDPARRAEAETEFKSLLQNHPDTVAGLAADFYLGYLEFARGDFVAAARRLTELRRHEDLSPDLRHDVTAYGLWALLEQGNDADVRTALAALFQDETFLARAPSEFLLRVGEHYLATAPDLALIGLVHVAAEDAVQQQRALLGRGQIHAGRGEHELALAALRASAAVAADPVVTCRADAWLGELMAKTGRDDEALVHLERAMANPADPKAAARARLGLARILSRQHDRLATANRHAMAVFILGTDPELAAAAMLLSVQISLRLERHEEAANTWREMRQRFPATATSDEGQETAVKLRAAGISDLE